MEKRSMEIDALRGWAIFLVVLGHSVIYYPIDLHQTIIGRLIYNMATSVHISLFFLISGYCFRVNNSYKDYINKKIRRLFIPYIIFNIFDMIPRYFLSSFVNRPRGIVDSIYKVILYGGEYWFLYVMFIIVLIYPIIYRFCGNEKIFYSVLVIIFILMNLTQNIDIFLINGVCRYLFWFHLGRIIGNTINKKKISINGCKHKIVTFFIGVIWFFSVNLQYDFWCKDIFVAFIAIIFAILAMKFCFFKSFFSKFGKNSLQIYLLNGFLLVLSRTIICRIVGNNLFIIITFNMLVDFFFSYYLIRYILFRFKLVKIIMGAQ